MLQFTTLFGGICWPMLASFPAGTTKVVKIGFVFSGAALQRLKASMVMLRPLNGPLAMFV
jgi:hypothetical protein